jgi:hypothetical protein
MRADQCSASCQARGRYQQLSRSQCTSCHIVHISPVLLFCCPTQDCGGLVAAAVVGLDAAVTPHHLHERLLEAIVDAVAVLHPTQVYSACGIGTCPHVCNLAGNAVLVALSVLTRFSACLSASCRWAAPARNQRARFSLCPQRVQVLPDGPAPGPAAAERPRVPRMQWWHGWRAHRLQHEAVHLAAQQGALAAAALQRVLCRRCQHAAQPAGA